MKSTIETKLIGTLLPSHQYFIPILKDIREKYNIPEIGPEDDGITEILLADEDIDWEEVHQEIKNKISNLEEIFPEQLLGLIELVKNLPETSQMSEEAKDIPENLQEQFQAFFQTIITFLAPTFQKINEFIDTTANHLFEFLTTGEAREIPQDWLGIVMTVPFFDDEPIIVAMASRLSDPKVVVDEFRMQFNHAYGKDRPKITGGQLKSAEYLRMKFEGKSITDITDVYILRNRSQFPKDPSSPEYRAAKRKLEERMKKNLQRYKERFYKILGDKN